MKKFKMLLALCLAVLLCFGTAGIAMATEEPAQRTFHYDNYFSNWDQVYCYAWSGENANAAWPGVPMTQSAGSALWKLTIDDVYDSIIFNDGQNIQTLDLTILDNYDTFYGSHMSSGKVNGFWRNAHEYTRYAFMPMNYWDGAACYVSYWSSNISQQSWPGVKLDNATGNWHFFMLPPECEAFIINNGGNGKQTPAIVKNSMGSNSIGLTGNISGYDIYGNALYEIQYLSPIAG